MGNKYFDGQSPVNISNFNILKNIKGDTAVINMQSSFFAGVSERCVPYINGKQQGMAYVNFAIAIPYDYRTRRS